LGVEARAVARTTSTKEAPPSPSVPARGGGWSVGRQLPARLLHDERPARPGSARDGVAVAPGAHTGRMPPFTCIDWPVM
jgi:hypothetical protein